MGQRGDHRGGSAELEWLTSRGEGKSDGQVGHECREGVRVGGVSQRTKVAIEVPVFEKEGRFDA